MNAELRRNLWLELSVHRLVGAPIVLLIVLLLVSSRDERPWPSVYHAAAVIFVLVVHFWGMRRASESVTDEVRERTWDWQRLSSLAPWSMTWGKLAGSAAFCWYVGVLCLAVMGVAGLLDRSLEGAPWTMLGLAASAVLLHAAGLAASIQASRKDSRLGARLGTFALLPLAVAATVVYMQGARNLGAGISWYGMAFDAVAFVVLSACAFAAWAVLSAYREMKRELKERALPWAAPAFVLFVGAYAAGFDAHRAAGPAFVFGTFFASLALAYYGLFAELTTAMTLRRFVLRVRDRRWRRAAEEAPLWATALAMGALFAALSALQPVPPAWGFEGRIGLHPVAFFLMALRDAGLLAFFALGARTRRVEVTTLLYIVLLGLVLPMLFSAMGLEIASRLLVPFRMEGWQAALVMAAHVAIVWGAALARGRRMERALER